MKLNLIMWNSINIHSLNNKAPRIKITQPILTNKVSQKLSHSGWQDRNVPLSPITVNTIIPADHLSPAVATPLPCPHFLDSTGLNRFRADFLKSFLNNLVKEMWVEV